MRKSTFAMVFLGTLFALIFGYDVIAQENLPSHLQVSPRLAVSPYTFEIDVSPGEKLERVVKIFNQSESPMPINVRPVDFSAKEDSGDIIFDEMSQDPSISARKWVNIDKPNFILEPGETKSVDFSIDVPDNAEPGGHYATLFFEPTLPSFYFTEGQPRAIPVMGVLLILSVKTFSIDSISDKAQAEIVEFAIKPENRMRRLENALASAVQIIPSVQASGEVNIVEKTPFGFLLRIKNYDIFHHRFEGKIIVRNIFGVKIGEAEVKKTTVLPGKIRILPADFNPETPGWLKWLPAGLSDFLSHNGLIGAYSADLEIKTENSNKILLDSKVFWAFSWRLIGPALLFLLGVILMRRRLAASLITLFGRKPKDENDNVTQSSEPWTNI